MIATKQDNKNEMLPLVDEEGHIVGCATRGECHGGSKPLHPVVHLHVFNRQGQLYLQLRPMWKDVQPGKWDTAVGGHVDWGESVQSALHREMEEELGLTDVAPVALDRYVHESDVERELVNSYYVVTEREPKPSAELDGGKFWSLHDIVSALGHEVFTPNFEEEFRRSVRKRME